MAAFAESDAENTTQKVALITGASSGFWRSTAETLAREGVRVALAARRRGELERLKNRVERGGGTALVVQTDITDESDVQKAIARIDDRFGRRRTQRVEARRERVLRCASGEIYCEDTEYIRVTDIEPGLVETDLSGGLPTEWMETFDPADVARSVRYAVSQPSHVDVNEVLLRPTRMEL